MTINKRFAVTLGSSLILLALILFFYQGYLWGAILLGLGAILILIGKKMN